MKRSQLDRILEQIAKEDHSTIREVRKEMQATMEEAQNSSDPAVQALWATIPRKSAALTLEEFISYLANKSKSSPS